MIYKKIATFTVSAAFAWYTCYNGCLCEFSFVFHVCAIFAASVLMCVCVWKQKRLKQLININQFVRVRKTLLCMLSWAVKMHRLCNVLTYLQTNCVCIIRCVLIAHNLTNDILLLTWGLILKYQMNTYDYFGCKWIVCWNNVQRHELLISLLII